VPRRKARQPIPRMPAGFSGQRMVVLPRPIVRAAHRDPLLATLLVTDIGYFPRAGGHYMSRPHGAEQVILIYCTHGRGWCELAGTRHELHPGDLLIVPAQRPHAYGSDDQRPWTIHWLHAVGSQVGPLTDAIAPAGQPPTVRINDSAPIVHLFDSALARIVESHSRENLAAASLCVAHLFGEILYRRRHADLREQSTAERLEHVLDLMRSSISGHITVQELSAAANFSESHFSTLFKKRTGFSVVSFFTRLKMQHACHLLDSTALSIKAIAAELGFDDPLYFSRQFRQIHEVSPKEYRAIKKG
jgi:AraC family transcriptional regulator, arabinose operon regulatory protein